MSENCPSETKSHIKCDTGQCMESCEYCDYVDRGMEDCHIVYWISERCPLYKNAVSYKNVTGQCLSIEYITRFTGCIHFKIDKENERINRESEEHIRKLYERRMKADGGDM
jgi:hypothetical protein